MPSYVYDPKSMILIDKGLYYARKFGEIRDKISNMPMPYVRGDLPTYISPVTGKPVNGRRERREDLARSGCREVDPSEHKPVYKNYEFCQINRLPYMGGDVPPPISKDARMHRKELRAKEAAAAKAVGAKPKED